MERQIRTEQRVREEQLQLLFAGLPSSLAATMVLLALTVAVTYVTGVIEISFASLGIVLVSAARFAMWLAYCRRPQRENISWSTLFFIGCIAAGSAWGFGAVLVFPAGNIAAQAFLAFVIAGVSAGAVTTLAAERRAALGFVLPCVLPLSARLLLEPGIYSVTMGFMVGVYALVISAAALRLSHQICENIGLRLQASQQQRTQERSERALAVANHQLRDFIDAADHVAIIALDANGIIAMMNRGAEKMLGYNEQELADKLTLELLLDADEVQEIASELSNEGRQLFGLHALLQYSRETGSFRRECIFVDKNSRRLYVDLVLTPTHGDDGAIDGFLATAIDIGERKRSAEALTRMNERFVLATHSAGMGVWDWDVKNDTLMWDERTYEIYGAPRDLQPDMNYMMRTVHPDDVERTKGELVAALSGKQPQLRTTFRIICPSGEERVVSASGLTLRNASGRAFRMTGLLWDITEIQRVERMKNEFVATVSHELRTPLTSIRGSLGLVSAGVAGKLPERAAGLVTMALNNCERLTLLINDILDMEKLESEKQRFDVRRMNVSELVTRSLEDNAGFAQSLNVRFVTPEPLCHKDVMVDPSRFLQVMANLLSNASKFSPAGAAIEVTAGCQQGRVRVAVRDFGKGIPLEFQSRIFQKFSQADSSDSRNRNGTGLGLAISRAIVERLGGHIGFETGAGGTTFFFELPDADSVSTQNAAPQRSKAS
ncbi:ATP-binding protein [Steroidobacter sp.]|uniref:ATP-binding protein n=1 Tax=Steroidobacter sp. TaxID=1978227 RepID=UPI001A4B3DFB|nr:ATP-binding protein [Steroidobacter sp.]MBL8269441.1 PAS domain S-box protein [Steroidobacter sp.]